MSTSPRTLARIVSAALFVAASALSPRPVLAQAAPVRDSLLDRMVGHWVLNGTIAGQQTTHDVDADWVLGHGYVRLHEVSREQNADGSPVYEAIVTLGVNPGGPGYACMWLDNTSPAGLTGQGIGHAEPAAGDSIAFVFASDDGSRFHTTFRYERARDRWTWLMDGEGSDGARQPFARLTLSRR